MARSQPQMNGIAEIISSHLEWLIVRENGRTLPSLSSEIEISNSNGRSTLSFVGEKGITIWRIKKYEVEDSELVISLSSTIRNESETIRLVPRESAAELRANIELARLQKANEIAEIFASSADGAKLVRVALN